jgi:aromatic-L-amino-acid/L-tryptophan decarboxylase
MNQREDVDRESPPDASLELGHEAMRALSEQATALVTEYFDTIPELAVFPDEAALERLKEIRDARLTDEGEALEQILDDFRAVVKASRHNGHPRFFGYIASPSTAVGAYADLLASALNSNVTSWRSGPAATEVERAVVGWLAHLVGFGRPAQGLLTSGGSLANLTALLMAHRAASEPSVARLGLRSLDAPMTVYASDQVHLSIPKAADILGLGRDHVRTVGADGDFRIDVRELRAQIKSDIDAGFKPFCVVGNAGTVNTGAIDPLEEVASVAEEFGLWFHVDGAYGAPGALDESKRALFRGLERADSVSLDAHKWLYAPLDCGCLLFRDAARAHRAFSADGADYIKVHENEEREAFAFWDYGIELSRRFRALKLWMMLRYYGVRRLREAISKDNALAQYMAERINASGDFELMAPVSLSVCCFRYVPESSRAGLDAERDANERERLERALDDINTRIMKTVQRGGLAYLSNATLRGRFCLRASITNFRTTRADIDRTLGVVREAAAAAEGDKS